MSAQNTAHTQTHALEEGDIDLVSMWLKLDTTRIMAGAFGGVVAGLIALVLAMVFSAMGGYEFLFAAKVPAIPLLGAGAMTEGFHFGAVATGLIVHLALSALLGMVYAHFTVTNAFLPLLGAGFTWGTFSWIFIYNLFIQSFREINALQLPRGPGLFVCLAFGFSLVTVGVFDSMFRGSRR